jgi:hypothetical protein
MADSDILSFAQLVRGKDASPERRCREGQHGDVHQKQGVEDYQDMVHPFDIGADPQTLGEESSPNAIKDVGGQGLRELAIYFAGQLGRDFRRSDWLYFASPPGFCVRKSAIAKSSRGVSP